MKQFLFFTFIFSIFNMHGMTVTRGTILDLLDHKEFFFKIKNITRIEPIIREMIIKGDKIHSLIGLAQIPSIKQCRMLTIKRTHIESIEESDFVGISHLSSLSLDDNKYLNQLKKGCFNLLRDLTYLYFSGNNIEELGQDVFTLPILNALSLENNGLKRIKTNWGAQLKNLQQLYLFEPNLVAIEPGWLNGIEKLNYVFMSKKIDSSLINQIKADIHNKFGDTVKIKVSKWK